MCVCVYVHVCVRACVCACAYTKLVAYTICTRGFQSVWIAVRKAGESVGYDQLKDEHCQVKVLCTFMEGRDMFVSLPTGFGKSLCYMLLPLVFDYLRVESDGKAIVVVVSPLIALMEDQVPVPRVSKSAFIDSENDMDKKASVSDHGCLSASVVQS